ncbi:MAG: APC family permease [Actinomycetota bacterium]|nr:APC family permease [Actinomycetota bacterium]
MSTSEGKMGFNATWSMAVGGMVGGGIFTVLGVIIALAGSWAWLSFVLGGIVALCTGYSYASLSVYYHKAGGAFEFLREAKLNEFAGGLSWVLLLGYVLTISVYGFTFGHYLGAVVGGGAWLPRFAAVAIIGVLVVVNLRSVGESSWLEIVTVWGKLAVLLGLAGYGLWTFTPSNVVYADASPGGIAGGLIGAAAIFMAYEGFQLLTYDYDDIREVDRVLPKATLSAILSVIVVYIVVTLGAASLVGADQLVAQKEVALAAAGEAALGLAGKVLVSVAAVFSTASAINATLFATARLGRRVAEDGELPSFFAHENRHGIPDRAVLFLGIGGASLAALGNLDILVEAASLAFLFTFVTVNGVAGVERIRHAWISWIGVALGSVAIVALMVRLALTNVHTLAVVLGVGGLAVAGRLARHWLNGRHAAS